MTRVQFENWLPIVLEGLGTTAVASVIAIITAIIWGCIVAMLIAYNNKVLTGILRVYVSIFRSSPLLVQLFFIFYGLPFLGITMPATVCGILGITLNEGAFIAEILRGSVKNIPKGEIEAAESLGLSRGQIIRHIIFPLSIRTSVPMLTGQASIIIKDTSLFSMIMVVELTRAANVFYAKYYSTTSFYIVAVLYIALFLIATVIGRAIEKRSKIVR